MNILRRCADAAGVTGRVLIVEMVGADAESPNTHMDLLMLSYFGGRERGSKAIEVLAVEAGLAVSRVYLNGRLAVIELSAS